MEIGECQLDIELTTYSIIEEHCNTLIIIEITLEKKILEEHKIIQVKVLELDIEAIIEMTTLEEVEVGLGKDNIQVILEGIIEAVVVDQDQAQD